VVTGNSVKVTWRFKPGGDRDGNYQNIHRFSKVGNTIIP